MVSGESVPELSGNDKPKRATKADIKKFKALTDFIIVTFGLEPVWQIEVIVTNDFEEHLTASAYTTHAPHYRDASITVRPQYLIGRVDWIPILIHELTHIMMAEMHDFLLDNTGQLLEAHTKNLNEQTVSEVANIFLSIFQDAHGKEIKQWL